MERLYALLYSFLPAAASIEPKAERYLLLLNVRVEFTSLFLVYFFLINRGSMTFYRE